MNSIIEGIRKNPVVAAVLKENDLYYAVKAPVKTVFLLRADIFNIKSYVDMIQGSGKNILIHVDFLEGFARDNKALDYIAKVVKPDGIISTKSAYVKYAKECGIFTIQRFFVVDSLAYKTIIKEARLIQPDMVEIMPAVIPKAISFISGRISSPVIAGGLIDTKEEIIEVLKAGAAGVSIGEKQLWGFRRPAEPVEE